VIGKTLSHYRITAALGAGGMGEVYRATDTNLNREVAIKVLPEEVARDEERLARFRREAQLLASLNHPNVAAIYGLEEADGQPFLALELVEGEDLATRLKRGAIPVDEALEIARQIAEGIEAAHEEGIVHRDLKPANVKLTPDGKVKVLDFGLAKAWAGDPVTGSSSGLSQSPTLAHAGTAAGLILGTAAYMSPEQARGKAVSKRADVWGFGVLLWEMLKGRSLFSGETVTDVIAGVMTQDPDLEALPAGTPRAVRRLIGRCLRRDPRARTPDIGAARLDLQEVLSGTGEEGAAEPAEGTPSAIDRRRQTRERWAWATALVLFAGIAAVLAVLYFSGEAPEAPPAAHFVLDLPDDLDLRAYVADSFPAPAVSPDGRHVVFAATSTGRLSQIWIRSLDAPGARPLPGTEGGRLPFWSPDGGSLAFAAGGDLKKLTLDSGTVRRIGSLPGPTTFWGGTWNEEGTIVFASGPSLHALPETGGEARPLTGPDESRGETRHSWPQLLPDGRHFLFVINSDRDSSRGLYVASLDAPNARRRLVPADNRVIYASGHLLSRIEGTLYAQPFDAGRLEVAGEPLPVAENVGAHVLFQAGLFGAWSSGVLAYVEIEEQALQLTWLARSGEPLETVGGPESFGQIVLSPDGSRVALEIAGEEGVDLWVMDVSRGVTSRVTSAPGSETDPVWSPDGQELVYHAGGNAFRQGLGSGALAVPLSDAGPAPWPESWSRDGETLLYVRSSNSIWALPLGGGGPPELVLETGFQLDEPHLSPDERWLAYISDESGDWEVYIEPFGRPGERVRISTDGGGQPKWRQDGRELFYASSHNMLMAVAVREEAGHLEVGLPTELFEIPTVQRQQVDDYAVSADGQRFLVKTRVEATRDQRIHVVTNWPSLLE
jgi:Tol biopolymer transport system component